MGKAKAVIPANRWKEYHEYMRDHKNDVWKDTVKHICGRMGITERSYYRKMEEPESLSPIEKEGIAAGFQLPTHFLFPEMELQSA